MINELNPAIQITVDQYERYTYTVEATQNLWDMLDSAQRYTDAVRDREIRIAQQVRECNTVNPEIGHLFH